MSNVAVTTRGLVFEAYPSGHYGVGGDFVTTVVAFAFSPLRLRKRVHFILSLIQSMYRVTLVYTPGYPGSPHLLPNDTIPICIHRPSFFNINGPPESPCNHEVGCVCVCINYAYRETRRVRYRAGLFTWQASFPPSFSPAQMKSSLIG